MTETEANLTRCCGPSDCGHESDNGPGGPGRYCIGSACMAWRTWVKPTGVMTTAVDGFCGLAGAPQ